MQTYPYPPRTLWILLEFIPVLMLGVTALVLWLRYVRWRSTAALLKREIAVHSGVLLYLVCSGLLVKLAVVFEAEPFFREWEGYLFGWPWLFIFWGAVLGLPAIAIVCAISDSPETIRQGREHALFLILLLGWQVSFGLPAVGNAREAARASACLGHMKQLALGMHNYHDIFQHFPTSANLVDDQPTYSWRVAVLPYIDSKNLWEQYAFGEAWDSSSNKLLLPKRPSTFTCPSLPHEAGPTFPTAYVIPTGPGTWTSLSSTPRLEDITDGLSNTILILEACGQRIPWTEPRDAVLSQQSLGVNLPGTAPGLSNGIASTVHQRWAVVGMADGRVASLSLKIDPQVLKALLSANGKDHVPDPLVK